MGMVDQTARILNSIYAAMDEINQQLPFNSRLSHTPDEVLYAQSGALDSFGLANLIAALEAQLHAEFGEPIRIADKITMRQAANPFRTVSTLTLYISGLIETQFKNSQTY